MSYETKEEAMYSVYAIRCKATGRVYIGCTRDVKRRINQHMIELRAHKKIKYSNVKKIVRGKEWQDDFDTYGEESFEFYIMESGIPFSNRQRKEAEWIRKYDACDPTKGYNAQCQGLTAVNAIEIKEGLPPLPEA